MPTPNIIRVMSFNIWDTGEPHPWEENPRATWANRLPLVVNVIRRYYPTLIGFQEFSQNHWETLRDQLPEYETCAKPFSAGIGNAIFFRPDRFTLRDSGSFWLHHNPDDPTPDWDLEYGIGVQWVLLVDNQSGRPLLFMNAQYEDGWDPNQVQMREEGSHIYLRQIEKIAQQAPGVPVILSGDFNCNVWDEPYRLFVDSGFVDTYRAAGHGDSTASSTYHGYVGDAYSALVWGDEQCWRVDWILTRDGDQQLKTVAATILHDAQPPFYPSDHYPIIADLRVLG